MEQDMMIRAQTERQKEDILLEFGNIGTGSSMASLSHMIGSSVYYEAPVMARMDYDGLAEWIGYVEECVVAVLIPFHGDMNGMLLQIYKKDMVAAILKKLLTADKVQEEMDGRMLDLIREIANITASSFLSALSSCADLKISLSDSAVSMDMTGAIVTELLGTAAGTYPNAYCIGDKFSERENGAKSCMLMVLHEDSVPGIMRAVEVTG